MQVKKCCRNSRATKINNKGKNINAKTIERCDKLYADGLFGFGLFHFTVNDFYNMGWLYNRT